MLNYHSPLTLNNKILIYGQYGCTIRASASTTQTLKDSRTGFYELSLALGTLGRIQTLYTDLNMMEAAKTIDKRYTKLHLKIREHVKTQHPQSNKLSNKSPQMTQDASITQQP
jgi:hypothetical protein